jgi:UDP-3-O-[3-hydroxymyristoyl] glucosamine N-acyltransferase
VEIRMRLGDFFSRDNIVKEGTFAQTMYPATDVPDSICYAANLAFLKQAQENPNITCIITTPSLIDHVDADCGIVAVDNPRLEYYHLHNRLVKDRILRLEIDHLVAPDADIHPTAVVGHPVRIEPGARIGPYSVIGDNTVIGEGTFVGDHVTLSVRGMQNTSVAGRRIPIAYAGGVQIGAGCEILTAAIIQKPYHAQFTQIGDGSVISVRVTVGHGSKVGRDVAIAGGVQIAGNCRIGDSVRIGPLAVLSDAVRVGDGADIKLGSVVVEDVPPNGSVSGNFALPHVRQLRRYIKAKRENV